MTDPTTTTAAATPAATTRSTDHGTFAIERVFAHPPELVYRAFGDPTAKAGWFFGPDGSDGLEHTLDFRVGGREHMGSAQPDGSSFTFDATYLDIVPDERIIYAYEMTIGGRRISASLACLVFHRVDGGTHLTVTEHGIFLDGLDRVEERERGTRELLDQLGTWLDAGGAA
jgi:uncharacterized protein YndB with AHSA1/START domain